MLRLLLLLPLLLAGERCVVAVAVVVLVLVLLLPLLMLMQLLLQLLQLLSAGVGACSPQAAATVAACGTHRTT